MEQRKKRSIVIGILPIIKRNNGCDYHRIILPLQYMGVDTNVPKISTDELLAETRIIIFNRTTDENPISKVLTFKKRFGFKIVLDLDDYWELNVNHPMYKIWNRLDITKKIIEWIKVADAVTVTTSRLADKVKLLNENVHVIPNALPFDEGQFKQYRTESENVRFIFAGSVTHNWDLKLLKIPFEKINNKLNGSTFTLAGFDENNPDWLAIEKGFTLGGKLNGYIRRKTEPLHTYMRVYDNADVSLVPLEFNTFNPFKSNLKFLEAGCKHMPVICSNVPPYSDEPYKNSIIYANNTKDWVDRITYCAKNKEFVKDKGQELGTYVRQKYDLRNINTYRQELFEHLMN